MGAFVRGALVVVGVLAMFGGLVAIVSGSGFALPGLEAVAFGAFLVVVVAIERSRYRSDAAELTNATPGPGGGEPADGPLEPRFRPTAEVFIDPTTGRQMRVVVDPANGERRYVAEG
jgi:hypothetical protein